ncbi:ABC transporter ATP-binding protein (plasmid) [Embleya sp. NBC_00888]|uniref:ABC transporter ATP-binding protein n=1 Tax=Embleya sp. NBC_00888 TaxID=2975960 RepID=UPI002F918179|nr:ABC transporter ATP-binding protein [Embleya sp. NBC_00888]
MSSPSLPDVHPSAVDPPPAPGPDTPVVVRAEGLAKVYPDGTTAVHGLDLAVRRGEVFALLGPNGAGKSTTVGMLTTAIVPTSGRALVAGVDVATHPAAARREIGVVPQRNTLDRGLTVRENLVFHGRYFGLRRADARREADRGLARVALTAVADKPVDGLSGGMAQRLMIARAILHRPAVLFLDEPTTGLDPQSRLALHALIRELRAAGQTTVLITHDMDEADRLADRVAIIDRGRLLALDTPDALKRSINADTVVAVSAHAPTAEVAEVLRARIPGARDVRVHADTVSLTVRGEPAVFPIVVAALADARIAARDVRVEEPSLETVFIRLTGKELRD